MPPIRLQFRRRTTVARETGDTCSAAMSVGDRSPVDPLETTGKDRDSQHTHFRTTGGRSLLHDGNDVPIPSPSFSPRTILPMPHSPLRLATDRALAMSDFILGPPPPPRRHPPPHRLTYPLSQADTGLTTQYPLSAPSRQLEPPGSSPLPPTPKHEIQRLPYLGATPTEGRGRLRHSHVSPSHLAVSNPDGPVGPRLTTDGTRSLQGSLPRPDGRISGPFGEAARGPSIISGTSEYRQSSAAFSTRGDGSLSPKQSILPDRRREADTMGRSREIDDERRKLSTRTDLPRLIAADIADVSPGNMHRSDRAVGPTDRGAPNSSEESKRSSRVSAFFNRPADHSQQVVHRQPSRKNPFASPPPTGPNDAV